MDDLPIKLRDIHNHHMNSCAWDKFNARDNDIIIATYAKSGTTWLQQIIGQLIFHGNTDINIAEYSPWLDLRIIPLDKVLESLESLKTRRFIKTHLPVDALVFHKQCRYIYIARDGRDVVWSLYNHFINANDTLYNAINNTPGRIGTPIERPSDDIIQYFKEWLDGDGYPFWSFWESIKSWWDIKHLENVLLLHFNDLKNDLPGNIRKIAEFINEPIIESEFNDIVEHCTFKWMKENGSNVVPGNGDFWSGGISTFINKGTNRRWIDILPENESKRYEQLAIDKLGKECAEWLNQKL